MCLPQSIFKIFVRFFRKGQKMVYGIMKKQR